MPPLSSRSSHSPTASDAFWTGVCRSWPLRAGLCQSPPHRTPPPSTSPATAGRRNTRIERGGDVGRVVGVTYIFKRSSQPYARAVTPTTPGEGRRQRQVASWTQPGGGARRVSRWDTSLVAAASWLLAPIPCAVLARCCQCPLLVESKRRGVCEASARTHAAPHRRPSPVHNIASKAQRGLPFVLHAREPTAASTRCRVSPFCRRRVRISLPPASIPPLGLVSVAECPARGHPLFNRRGAGSAGVPALRCRYRGWTPSSTPWTTWRAPATGQWAGRPRRRRARRMSAGSTGGSPRRAAHRPLPPSAGLPRPGHRGRPRHSDKTPATAAAGPPPPAAVTATLPATPLRSPPASMTPLSVGGCLLSAA